MWVFTKIDSGRKRSKVDDKPFKPQYPQKRGKNGGGGGGGLISGSLRYGRIPLPATYPGYI